MPPRSSVQAWQCFWACSICPHKTSCLRPELASVRMPQTATTWVLPRGRHWEAEDLAAALQLVTRASSPRARPSLSRLCLRPADSHAPGPLRPGRWGHRTGRQGSECVPGNRPVAARVRGTQGGGGEDEGFEKAFGESSLMGSVWIVTSIRFV